MLRPTVGFEFKEFGATGCPPGYFEQDEAVRVVKQIWDPESASWGQDETQYTGRASLPPSLGQANEYLVNVKRDDAPEPIMIKYLGQTILPTEHPKTVDCAPRVTGEGLEATIFRYAVVPIEPES